MKGGTQGGAQAGGIYGAGAEESKMGKRKLGKATKNTLFGLLGT